MEMLLRKIYVLMMIENWDSIINELIKEKNGDNNVR